MEKVCARGFDQTSNININLCGINHSVWLMIRARGVLNKGVILLSPAGLKLFGGFKCNSC